MPLTFSDWRRSRLHGATTTTEAGRRTGSIDLTLVDSARPTAPATGAVAFRLVSGADVAALTPGTIRHRAPGPGEATAETTKCVHVDFADEDFCWRYSPTPNGPAIRPWLVLLVGTPDEIRVDGGQAGVASTVLAAHQLSQSPLWAHRMSDGARTISRLLSFRPLRPQTSYVAVLVPAVDAGGGEAWPDGAAADLVLPVLDTWRFQTAEAGDFETLAAALRIPPPGDLGHASLHYRRRDVDLGPVQVGGALTSLRDPAPPDPDTLRRIRADLTTVTTPPSPPDPRWGSPLEMPGYGPPWADPEAAGPEGADPGWLAALRSDVRSRSQAGIGQWMGVEGQEPLMRAAVEQAGALFEAAGLVRHLAFGLAAAGRLWERQLPADPTARLGVLGPMLHQLITGNGGVSGPALDRLCGPDTYLEPALFSGAAQRLAGMRPGELLRSANGPDDPDEEPAAGTVAEIARDVAVDPAHFGLDAERVDRLLESLTRAVRVRRPDFAATPADDVDARRRLAADLVDEHVALLAEHLRDGEGRCAPYGVIGAVARDLGLLDPVALGHLLLDHPDPEAVIYTVLQDAVLACLLDWHPAERPGLRRLPPDPRRPVDLDRLVEVVDRAVDPRGPRPPASAHVAGRVGGIDIGSLAPLRFPLGLDYPSWSLLREHDREWLLPGADAVPPDSVSALRTNPAFIDAFLVGLNTQFLSEARWRGLPVGRTVTPLRMFWGASHGAQRLPDITPLRTWTAAEPLGALEHQATPPAEPGVAGAERLVLLFHTPLFRRYPGTTVHLLRAPPDATDATLASLPAVDLKPPTFVGSLTPDLVFFLFDVPPDALDAYWLILDEPPAELRFRHDRLGDLGTPGLRSSTVAERALDTQTRVALSGAELEHLARGGLL